MAQSSHPEHELPWWAHDDPLMESYARDVWGRRIEDDDALFEIMNLQVFQAGLNWRMIWAKRDAFRQAFGGWKIDTVADMGADAFERLMNDASIVRNRRKIESCIANAAIVQRIQKEHGSFCNWFYSVLNGDDLGALQKELRRTFKFMGPEIARMWLMASGRIPSDY